MVLLSGSRSSDADAEALQNSSTLDTWSRAGRVLFNRPRASTVFSLLTWSFWLQLLVHTLKYCSSLLFTMGVVYFSNHGGRYARRKYAAYWDRGKNCVRCVSFPLAASYCSADKISPFSSALMPSSGSNFATPRNASPVGGEGISLPFSSPYRDDRSTLLKSHSFPQEGPLDGDASISTERRIDMDVNDGTAAGAGREAGNGGKSAGGINGLKRIFSSVPSPSHFRRSMSFAAISNAASRVAAGAMTPIRRRRHRRSASQGADVIDVSGRGNRGGRRTGDGGEGFVGSGESGRGSGKVKGRRRGSKDNRQCGRGAADTKLGWDSTKTGLLSPEDSPPRVNIFVDADASDADLRAVAKSTSAASSGIFFGDVGGRRKSSSTQVTPSRGRTRNRKDERQQKREAASCHREEGNQKSENSLQKASNGLAEWSWGPMSSTRRRGRSEHSHRQQAQTDELENRGRGDIARRHPSLEGKELLCRLIERYFLELRYRVAPVWRESVRFLSLLGKLLQE